MTPSFRVDGKVAVVTGAGRGLGRAFALGLAEAGARVVVAEYNVRTGRETAQLIGSDGALFVQTDVADPDSVASLADAIEGAYGQLDIIVNNAALDGAPDATLLMDLDPEVYDRVMAVNVKGMWLMVKALVPLLRRSGGGSVVNAGSTGAFLSFPGQLPYCTSKNAVFGVTKTLARELGRDHIRVNCLCPGPTNTESARRHIADKAVLDQLIASQCLPEQQEPEDLVGPLLFLVSDASRFVTGQALISDGGIVMLP